MPRRLRKLRKEILVMPHGWLMRGWCAWKQDFVLRSGRRVADRHRRVACATQDIPFMSQPWVMPCLEEITVQSAPAAQAAVGLAEAAWAGQPLDKRHPACSGIRDQCRRRASVE